ncbi:metallophosphoesterase, partial [Escherichia coli]
DIHGQDEGLLRLTNEHIPTHDLIIQVGDFGMGFQNNCKNFLTQTDPNKFKVIAGNHDNPTELATYPHCLGDFGVYEFGGKKIFFVR